MITQVKIKIILSLIIPTLSLAMEDFRDRNADLGENITIKKHLHICRNITEKITRTEIRYLFKHITKNNINYVEILDCKITYSNAKYLAKKANKHNIIHLEIPADYYRLTCNSPDAWAPKLKWKVQIRKDPRSYNQFSYNDPELNYSKSKPNISDRYNENYHRYTNRGLLPIGGTGGF
jgi:hypothetical protein